MKLSLCRDFTVVETEYGARVLTPFRFPDHDQVVVWVKREAHGFSLDDNGEAALRLASDGVDVDGERVQAWLETLPAYLGVRWDELSEMLVTTATEKTLEEKILAVAQASIQLSALSALRQERSQSDFKAKVLEVLAEIGQELDFGIELDAQTDESGHFVADALLKTARPVAVVVATTVQRLLEAQLMWFDAKHRKTGLYVLALVENAPALGNKQYTRANYHTDKTVEFAGRSLLKDLLESRVAVH